ncbi:hypothetical protein D9M73_73360 [compost metagenome]
MKFECKLKREGGTKVEIGGVEYHFKPLPDGAHVAEVTEEDHIARFYQIPEAYKAYKGDADTATAASTAAAGGTGDGDDADEPTEFLVTDGKGNDADLGKMNRAELLAFADKEEIALTVPRNSSREKILAAVFGACTEE